MPRAPGHCQGREGRGRTPTPKPSLQVCPAVSPGREGAAGDRASRTNIKATFTQGRGCCPWWDRGEGILASPSSWTLGSFLPQPLGTMWDPRTGAGVTRTGPPPPRRERGTHENPQLSSAEAQGEPLTSWKVGMPGQGEVWPDGRWRAGGPPRSSAHENPEAPRTAGQTWTLPSGGRGGRHRAPPPPSPTERPLRTKRRRGMLPL